MLDEPIAEAVCIIADTDKWTVQVASSQRRATDVNKLGKEVLVSSLVSSLLQSTHQLYKLNLSPNFVGYTFQSLFYNACTGIIDFIAFFSQDAVFSDRLSVYSHHLFDSCASPTMFLSLFPLPSV